MSTTDGQPETSAPQQPDVSTSESRLANRYGAPKRGMSRRGRIIVASAAVVLAVAAAAAISIPSTDGTVTSKDVGFSFPEEGFATVDFTVDKSPGTTVACAVQAVNESYAVVGFKTIIVGPEDPDSSTRHVTLRIDSPAVNGGVDSCWVVRDDQG